MYLFTVFILSLFLTIALIPAFKSMAFKMNIIDVPNDRNVHAYPMPKSGGISMAIGFFIPVLLWAPLDSFVNAVLLGSIIIVVFGLVDDIWKMRPLEKMFAQIPAALIVIFYGSLRIKSLGNLAPEGYILPNSVSVALTLFVIVGVTNAINLSDGLDGLAGGISMLTFVCIGFLAYSCDNTVIAVMSVAVIGSILGFLRYNTHPAILFMGDAGSQLLGFLSVIFALALTQANTPYSRTLPLLLIGFPILDTLTVMLERIYKGISPFKADKNHFHHRLMRLGLYHTEAVFVIYIFQAIFISSAVMFRYWSDWMNLLFFLIFSGLIIIGFALTGIKDWKVRRGHFLDTAIKGRLRVLKEKKIFIKIFFKTIKWGLPSLFLFQSLIPREIPWYLTVLACCFICMIAGIWFLKKKLRPVAVEMVLRLVLYIFITVIIFLGETDSVVWMKEGIKLANNIAFITVVFFVILTMNLTKRRKGFKITPQDFLVFFIVLILPNLPGTYFQRMDLEMIAAKVLVLIFSYDVLIGELRGQNNSLLFATILTHFVVVLRGIC